MICHTVQRVLVIHSIHNTHHVTPKQESFISYTDTGLHKEPASHIRTFFILILLMYLKIISFIIFIIRTMSCQKSAGQEKRLRLQKRADRESYPKQSDSSLYKPVGKPIRSSNRKCRQIITFHWKLVLQSRIWLLDYITCLSSSASSCLSLCSTLL